MAKRSKPKTKSTQAPITFGNVYSSTASPACHTNHHKLFEAKGVSFHLGKYAAVGERKHSVILDLAEGVKPAVNIVNPSPSLADFGAKYGTAIVRIYWPDMGIPNWTKAMWVDLCEALVADPSHVSVYMCCMGGHGRTGTAAAIIGSLLGAIPEDVCPAQFVRDNYCKSAVESESQLKYITEITGREVKAKASKGYYGGYSSGYDSGYGDGWKGGGHQRLTPTVDQFVGEWFDPLATAPSIARFEKQVYTGPS